MTTAQAIATNAHRASVFSETRATSRRRLWTGRILTALSSAFLILDAGMKLLKAAPVLEASQRIGIPSLRWWARESSCLRVLCCI